MNLITKYRIPASFIKCIKYLKMKDVFDPTNEDGSKFHEKIIYLVPAERMGEEVLFNRWCEGCRIYVPENSHLCSVCLFPPRTSATEQGGDDAEMHASPPTGVGDGSTGLSWGTHAGVGLANEDRSTLTARVRRKMARRVRRKVNKNKKLITVMPREDAARRVNECRSEFVTSVKRTCLLYTSPSPRD